MAVGAPAVLWIAAALAAGAPPAPGPSPWMAKKQGYKPADLTLERLNQQTDGEIFYKISKGKDPMPDFEKQLNGRERWDVVSYMRTLMRPAP